MNPRGQILLPGLAWFLGLLTVFFGLVSWGRVQLSQERMDLAASAAALSAARVLASELNACATRNMEANMFVPARYKGFGAMPPQSVGPFEEWLESRRLEGAFEAVLSGYKGQAAAVGSQVAKLNGATSNQSLSSLSLRLRLNDLDVFILPSPIPAPFEDVYYTRMWGYGRRDAQPPHQVVWSVTDGRAHAVAAARVYLDVTKDAPLQNGGFPRGQGEDIQGDIEIQSLYPQFNARLIPVPLVNKLLDRALS